MAVAKRQGRENPMKIEQGKVRGLEWRPQVEQTALLASPIYIGQAQRGGEKTCKKRSQRVRGLSHSLLFVSFGLHALMPRGCIFLYFLNKTELKHRSCNTDLSESWDTVCPRVLCFKLLLWQDRTEEITHFQDKRVFFFFCRFHYDNMIDWLNHWPMGIELNLSSSPLLRGWKGRGIRVQNSAPLKGNLRGFGKFINNEPNCDWRGLPWVTEDALSPFLPHYRATLKSRDEHQISTRKMPLSLSPLGNYNGF